MAINVLGTKYKVLRRTQKQDKKLRAYDGYCDTSKKIIVYLDCESVRDDRSLIDLSQYERKVLRHEIVHAFLYESGLSVNAVDGWAASEELVDWIAIQFPKLSEAFRKGGAVDAETRRDQDAYTG